METLDVLDTLERHPTHYTRHTINVTLNSSQPSDDDDDDDDVIQAEAYFMRNFRPHLLTTETLLTEYTDSPERRYMAFTERAAGAVVDIKQPHVP